MILIITHKEDFTADFVIDKLNNRRLKYYRLNCEDINQYDYCFDNSGGLKLNNIYDFSSIWFRRTKLPVITGQNEAEKMFLLSDYEALFDNIFNLLTPAKWLSHPFHVYRAENKLLQLSIAKLIGFNIPKTLVTNSHTRLSEFIVQNKSNVIVKPIRQGRIQLADGVKTIFTNLIDSEVIETLNEFDLTPCIIQENISKQYEIRVTVVDGKCFSAKINSQDKLTTSIDWRKEKSPIEAYKLPEEIQRMCIEMTKRLNLSFGAIDLIKNSNDEYVFLEINPNGQWAWIEMETGLNISDEIINYLSITS